MSDENRRLSKEYLHSIGNEESLQRDLQKAADQLLKVLDEVKEKAAGPTKTTDITGFIGGKDLAMALGVHPSRRDAFLKRLERERKSLGDNNWKEVDDPPPNSPRYLYLADSPMLRDLAVKYKEPKPT